MLRSNDMQMASRAHGTYAGAFYSKNLNTIVTCFSVPSGIPYRGRYLQYVHMAGLSVAHRHHALVTSNQNNVLSVITLEYKYNCITYYYYYYY